MTTTYPTRDTMTLIEGDDTRETRAQIMSDGSLLVWVWDRNFAGITPEWERDLEAGVSVGRAGARALRSLLESLTPSDNGAR